MLIIRIASDWLFWAAFFAAFFVIFAMHLIGVSPSPISLQAEFWRLLLLILFYPLVEEMAFRGWLQSRLLEQKWGAKTWFHISLANLITSFLFSLLHHIEHSPLWAISVIVPSLIFGFFKERYQSIQGSLILHVWYNASYFLLLPII